MGIQGEAVLREGEDVEIQRGGCTDEGKRCGDTRGKAVLKEGRVWGYKGKAVAY